MRDAAFVCMLTWYFAGVEKACFSGVGLRSIRSFRSVFYGENRTAGSQVLSCPTIVRRRSLRTIASSSARVIINNFSIKSQSCVYCFGGRGLVSIPSSSKRHCPSMRHHITGLDMMLHRLAMWMSDSFPSAGLAARRGLSASSGTLPSAGGKILAMCMKKP